VGQSFDSSSKKVGELLGSFERRMVVVPRFQRGYSWEKAHVDTFWTDVLTFAEEYGANPKSATYFYGPIVVQNEAEEIQLLDGQQRLATATVLLAVIRDLSRTLVFQKGQPGHDLAHEIQANLVQKEDSDPPFALRLGELDAEYFQQSVQQDPPDRTQVPTLRSHELINAAYKALHERVTQAIAGLDSDKALKRLKLIKDSAAKGMLVVAIDVASEDDAYSIFETLNDRGLRLSVPDLLLNLLMRRAASEPERVKVRKQWNEMLEQMGRKDIDRFLRHMWLSRYGDLKARGLFNELKSHLRDNQITSSEFASSCAVDCDFYVALLDQTSDISKGARPFVAGILKYLGVTSSLPLLLAGLECLNEADFEELARAIASLSVRYVMVADLNPSTLESAFYAAARTIRALDTARVGSKQILAGALKHLDPLWPADEVLGTKASAMHLTRSPAVWILGRMALTTQSKTGEVAIGDANLEHIYPRNANVTHWPNKDELDPLVWRLGNLTVLGEDYNRSASNKAYATKTQNYYRNSELVITKTIPDAFGAWTPTEVEARSKELAGLLVETFAHW
jgi:hypothetical protein